MWKLDFAWQLRLITFTGVFRSNFKTLGVVVDHTKNWDLIAYSRPLPSFELLTCRTRFVSTLPYFRHCLLVATYCDEPSLTLFLKEHWLSVDRSNPPEVLCSSLLVSSERRAVWWYSGGIEAPWNDWKERLLAPKRDFVWRATKIGGTNC